MRLRFQSVWLVNRIVNNSLVYDRSTIYYQLETEFFNENRVSSAIHVTSVT